MEVASLVVLGVKAHLSKVRRSLERLKRSLEIAARIIVVHFLV